KPRVSMSSEHIRECLQSDLLACDARLSLFVAAATSYRYASLLRLLPEELQNIDEILDTIDNLDRLETLLRRNLSRCDLNVLRLLHVVLVRHGEFVALTTLPSCDFVHLYAHLKIRPPSQPPTHIFEVTPSLKCEHTKAYARLREEHPVRIGFLAGRLDELYPMLTMGYLPGDEPVMLSFTVDSAARHCECSASWGASRCGAMLSCVAVVEYVMVVDQVSLCDNDRRVLVRDANCMQISYLIFYGKSVAEYEQSKLQMETRQLQKRQAKLKHKQQHHHQQQNQQQQQHHQHHHHHRQRKAMLPWHNTVGWIESSKYTLSLGVYLMILSLSSPNGRGLLHQFASTGVYVLRKVFLQN
ncbi:hypothetical protein KR222_004851, partial [Zaprionus bogoriensis]